MTSAFKQMNNLGLRIITAVFGAALLILAIVYDYWTFGLVFLLIMGLSLHEFYSLTRKHGNQPLGFLGLLTGVLFYVLVFLIQTKQVAGRFLWFMPVPIMVCFVFALYDRGIKNPLNALSITIFGIFYVGVPFSLLSVIAFRGGNYAYPIIIGVLLAQWANDTGAYFAGKLLGKTKLFERISPNKTWEGSIGGGILALAILYGWSFYFSELLVYQWLTLAFIVAVFGSLGDLVESLLKRTMAIKDSGKSIPGHGGFLDRFDGLIFSLPFATAYLMLLT